MRRSKGQSLRHAKRESLYRAQYTLQSRDGIGRVIEANQQLLNENIDISISDFKSIYNTQERCCAVSGVRLYGSASIGHREFLDTGIIRHNDEYLLVSYPFAHAKQFTQSKFFVQQWRINHNDDFPIYELIYKEVTDKLVESEINLYPIDICHYKDARHECARIVVHLNDETTHKDCATTVSFEGDQISIRFVGVNEYVIKLCDPNIIEQLTNVLLTEIKSKTTNTLRNWYKIPKPTL